MCDVPSKPKGLFKAMTINDLQIDDKTWLYMFMFFIKSHGNLSNGNSEPILRLYLTLACSEIHF